MPGFSKQEAGTNKGRVYEISTAFIPAHKNSPNTSPPQAPLFRLSEFAPNGLKTTGFTFTLIAPAAGAITPNAGNFNIIVWLWNPITQRYASFATLTGVDFDQLFVTYDIDGGADIFIQIDNVNTDGIAFYAVCEQ